MIGQKRSLPPKQVWTNQTRPALAGHSRDLALFGLAIDNNPLWLVRDRVSNIGLDQSGYGTHSLRRTKTSEIYRKTDNLGAVQLLLGHTKSDSTVRYLGVELEDALCIAERIDM